VLSLFFNYKNSARQSLTLVLCSLLRQLITTEKPVKIPQSVLGAWQNSQFSGKRPLDEHLARDLLLQELSKTEYKFLVIDALDEAEGCLNTIHTEIHRLRNYGVCIFSTEMHEHRVESDNAFCYRHQTGPGPWDRLILYWQCKKCHGPFGRGIEICQDCFVNKQLTCEDPSHVLRIPGRIHFEVRASPQDMERFAKQFLEDASSGGDVGDDDYMYAGNVPLLAMVKADISVDTWDTIPKKIAEAADGNFLHANLFLERLKEQRHTDGALSLLKRLQLGSLPDIEDQYHEKLARCLQGSGAQVARDHLSIIAAAMDVLQFDQLSHAAAITIGSRSLSDFLGHCCRQEVVRRDTAGLLSIDPGWQSDTFLVGFSHRTLSVYIKNYPEKTLPDAGQRMFDACVSYLSLDRFTKPFTASSQLDDALKEYPFASYAACYWAMHARDVKPTARNTLRVLELLGDPRRLDCAMQIAWHVPSMTVSTWDVSSGITPIHACAFYGLHTICTLLIDVVSSIDPVEEQYKQTPLIYACRQGHLEIVQLLLKAGANPNHLTKLGKSPLLEAIEFGHEEIFQLLIAEDTIDINLRGSAKNDRTPLVKAAELGRDSMVERLLSRAEIRVNNVDGWNCTALSRAVQNLQVDCVRQLLAHADTDLSLRDDTGDRTALDWLAEDFLDYDHNSDIIHAIATMLMDDSRAPLPSDDAIVSAIVSGKLELLRIYMEGSLHHLYTDTYGRNFLHLAATEGICVIVTLFHTQLAKESSFNIDSLDQYRATALHAACGRLSDTSHVETIKFLLDAGANPTLKDDRGYTPGMRARRASQDLWDSHVKTLFTSTNASDSNDLYGTTPITLRTALNSAKVDAFKAALDQLPEPLLPEIAHYSSSSILHHAMELPDDFRREVLSLLLPRSEKFLSDADADGQTCAHLAIKQNSLETLKLLCQAGIDINHRDRWGLTPFELAQRWQRLDLCVYLVSQGASLPPGDDIRPDVLRAAVESGDLASVKRLVQSGVDANFRDVFKGQTHLQRAEELKEKAARISNDELLARNDANIMKDKATWDRHRDNAPEVVRRDAILQYLWRLQDNNATTSARQAGPDRALTALVEKLKAVDPDTLLSTSSIKGIVQRTRTPDTSIGHCDMLTGPSSSNPGVALQMYERYDVGNGVVMIVIAIVLGTVAVAIAWIVS
jgi:ankyrin repeat protein